MMRTVTTLFFAAILLAACGKKGGGGNSSRAEQQEEDLSGEYRAIIRPLNPSVTRDDLFGTAMLKVSDDELHLKLNLINAPSNVKHLQSIHPFKRCPTMAHDRNKDGLVDAAELMRITGKILVPLDGDLTSQLAGLEYAPVANGSGAYSYEESASLTTLVDDLYAKDQDLKDAIIKLKKGHSFNLSGLSFVIYGISSNAELPASVAAIHDLSNEASLPVACGEIVRIVEETSALYP